MISSIIILGLLGLIEIIFSPRIEETKTDMLLFYNWGNKRKYIKIS